MSSWPDALAVLTITLPAFLLLILGGSSLMGRRLPEPWSRGLTAVLMSATVLAAGTGLAWCAIGTVPPHVASLGQWFVSGSGSFAVDLLIDPMAFAFATLAATICGVAAAFSTSYLHREPGYNRYFVQFATLATGIQLVAFAGSIEVLFTGWELVGLSSALLVAFFHYRPAPVRNALRVFAVYRISDAAMLGAAVLLHHVAGSGSLALLFGQSGAAHAQPLAFAHTTAIGALLLVAVAGKSALLPFSGWLPRAMEGPTPSSAIYYGALSVHAGCFLLLRAAPLLEQSVALRAALGILGLATAVYATFAARVQSDIKSALALATLTQVGIVASEIALGLRTIAWLHLTGHACFRMLQFLTAPNVIHEFHQLENRIGGHFAAGGRHWERVVPRPWQPRLYRFALERGGLDELLDRFLVEPLYRLAHALDHADRSVCDVLLGHSRATHRGEPRGRT